jgi:cyclopropane fatty-acyl-phospholipid synthase-like methyltransferase
VGKLQFDFLVAQGLKPEDRLLDVGCGSLRGGVHFVNYLQEGHYYGIDIDKALLDAGRKELETNELTDKNPVLVEMGDFDFQSLDQKFDFALAQSVFTHLPLNSVIRCIMNIDKVLVKGGRFYATIFVNPEGKHNLEPIAQSSRDLPDLKSYFDQDPYHYDLDTLKWICEGTGLTVEYIGDWNHPRNQKMVVFTKK